MTAPNPIAEFSATVASVKTMADGSPRFTFDAPESEIDLLSILGRTKLQGQYLHVMVFDADEWQEYVKSTRK